MKARRIVFTLGFFAVPMAATIAFAQPNKGKPAPPPPEAAAPAAVEASDAAGPVAAPETMGDGGKWSPLNPAPDELRNPAIDAGVPVDYDRLLADVAALRARVSAVSDSLYR